MVFAVQNVPAHLNLITPPPQLHRTPLEVTVQAKFLLVFSKHMFLITSKQLEFSCPPHIQHSSSPHPTFHTPTPLLSHSYLPVEEFIWLAVLRQKQRGKTDRKRSFGSGRR